MSRVVFSERTTVEALQKQMEASKTAKTEKKSDGPSFSDVLNKSVSNVNNSQVEADNSISDFLTGGNTGVHETMMALEKADISMRLMVQVRNRALQAYREIMRMQV